MPTLHPCGVAADPRADLLPPRAGYTYACFDAVTFAAATAIEASLDVYVAQVALAHIHAWCTCPPVSTSILAAAHFHWC